MKKNASMLIIALFTAQMGFSQLKLAYGMSFVYGTSKKYVDFNGDKGTIELPGLGLWGRYMLNGGKISVGVPLSAMLNVQIGSRSGSSGGIGIDLPITAEYNLGLGSGASDEEETEAKFGGFVGGGFSYTYASSSNTWSIPGVINSTTNLKGSSYGPLVHAGLRAIVSNRQYNLRLFYKVGLEKAKFQTFGVSLLTGM